MQVPLVSVSLNMGPMGRSPTRSSPRPRGSPCVRFHFLQTCRCSPLVPIFWSPFHSMSPLLLEKSHLLKRCSFLLHLTSPNLRVEDLPRPESRWCLLKRVVMRVLIQFSLLAEQETPQCAAINANSFLCLVVCLLPSVKISAPVGVLPYCPGTVPFGPSAARASTKR